MIDNNHLVYGSVIMVFLLGVTIVALVGMLFLAVGFAVSMAVQFRKRRTRRKRLEAAPPVEKVGPLEEVDVLPPVCLDEIVSHLYEGTDGQGQGRRRADLPPVMNSVSL